MSSYKLSKPIVLDNIRICAVGAHLSILTTHSEDDESAKTCNPNQFIMSVIHM